jgi:hypothetical protein
MRMATEERLPVYTRPTGALRQLAAVEKALHFADNFRYRGIQHLAPRIDYDGPLRAQTTKPPTHGLADPALDAVAHHGLAKGARTGKSDARPDWLRFEQTERRKQGTGEAGAAVVDASKILGSQQANTFGKTSDRSLPLRTYSEFLAAARPAPRQHRAPVLRFHAGTETVRLGAVAVIRLKSAFRHLISIA